MFKKFDVSNLPEHLKKDYKFINFSFSSPSMVNPTPPNESYVKLESVYSFYSGEVYITSIIEYINNNRDDKDISHYALNSNYDELNGTEINLMYIKNVKSPQYQTLLKKYQKDSEIYEEEKKIFPAVLAAYNNFVEEEQTKSEIAQFNKLKNKLKAKQLID
jgi:hypothetical protein